MKVLLIDDEKELVTTLSERLEIRGISSDWAVSGEDGLELIKKQPYDWVVVDLKMPGLGGFEAIKAIKKQRPETRIILLTGHSSAEDLDHALKLGANRYLVKPVDIEDLLNLMMQP
ncbi:response regulator [Dethiosulfatarculus sandiegensis]|uniref:Histidine kinase n=1 Tax=Dethiosulfatarculus sandiegensis TaxID=1429043 RepID=A0A0D2JUF5_9BACT|nr:response regulator [Dethiosulfatarculus sandiegensis]KIX13135.1 histidine kinase [Dethiosulfatarculus sandiegensis]